MKNIAFIVQRLKKSLYTQRVIFFVVLFLVSVVLVSGCIGQGDDMVVEKGDFVSVDYWGTLEDGTQFDTSEGRGALEFTVGAGQMIKGFDDGVLGMKLNETKTIKMSAKDAYGEADPKLVQTVSIEDLRESGIEPEEGMTLYAQGQPVKVTKVTNTTATLDFNHPLAGKDLTFKVKMLKITKKK